MPSVASILIDLNNGVPKSQIQGDIPFPPAPSTRRSTPKREPHPPLTEAQLKNKEALRNALSVGVWTIDFIKVDGTPTTMECTLDQRHIPYDPNKINPVAPTTGAAAAAEHLLHVYALDRQGWRSFVVTNVRKIYKKPEEL